MLPMLPALCLALALAARPGSRGLLISSTALSYLERTRSGDLPGAWSLLTDSLQSLVLADRLAPLSGPPGRIRHTRIGRVDERGRILSVLFEDGRTRTIWLRPGGPGLRVSGDSSLDGLLAAAAMECRDYARESVIPAVLAGEPAGSFSCPWSGRPYVLEESAGRLACPAGHLGDGLALGDERCSARREEVLRVLELYLEAGYPFPESLDDVWRNSEGVFGQRGGYRCPDHGYSYYEIRDGQVFCPWHDAASGSEAVTGRWLESSATEPPGPSAEGNEDSNGP
ncbi:hypothetical protein JW921_00425 [Candidatus Fermentibacterales bacterium]|nr:hypothetical protein [Candidatus Fermentibacterales bacterium]